MASLLGWLDRAGNHYPASFMEHYNVAIETFGKPDWQLEVEGIVKIYIDRGSARHGINSRRGTDEVYYVQSPNRLSKAQFDWLVAHDFNIEERDMPL